MPLKLIKALKKKAKAKFPDDQARQDRYVWGTIQKLKEKGYIHE